jgi:hypothetical protein
MEVWEEEGGTKANACASAHRAARQYIILDTSVCASVYSGSRKQGTGRAQKSGCIMPNQSEVKEPNVQRTLQDAC